MSRDRCQRSVSKRSVSKTLLPRTSSPISITPYVTASCDLATVIGKGGDIRTPLTFRQPTSEPDGGTRWRAGNPMACREPDGVPGNPMACRANPMACRANPMREPDGVPGKLRGGRSGKRPRRKGRANGGEAAGEPRSGEGMVAG